MKKSFELPPTAFSNLMNKVWNGEFSFENWEESKEWEIFRAGYRYGLDRIRDEAACLQSNQELKG